MAKLPQIQQLPLRSPEAARVREAFRPADLTGADFALLELRVLAAATPEQLEAARNAGILREQVRGNNSGL